MARFGQTSAGDAGVSNEKVGGFHHDAHRRAFLGAAAQWQFGRGRHRQCRARCKNGGHRCPNPAVAGRATCRMHGGKAGRGHLRTRWTDHLLRNQSIRLARAAMRAAYEEARRPCPETFGGVEGIDPRRLSAWRQQAVRDLQPIIARAAYLTDDQKLLLVHTRVKVMAGELDFGGWLRALRATGIKVDL